MELTAMTSRTSLFMLMALIFGAAAVFLARQWLLQHPAGTTSASVNSVTVVVAAKDIAFGTHITADDVKEVAWPADALPQGAFTSRDKLLATNPVVIRRL